MKFAGAHGITRSRVPLIAMLALAGAIGLAGCEGDDGRDGAQGPAGPASTVPGPTGATGPQGATGPAGQAVVQKPLESCAVCHDAGSVYAVDDAHAIDREVSYTVVTRPTADENDLVVAFDIRVNGQPYNSLTLVQRTVIFQGVDGVPPAGRVYTRNQSLSDQHQFLESVVNGRYTFRIPGGTVFNGVAVNPADFVGTDARVYFRLNDPMGVEPRRRASIHADDLAYARLDLVSNESCTNCHGTFAGGLTQHHYNPFEASNCIACHSAVNPPAGLGLAYLAHGIHSLDGFTTPEDTYSTTYPTYMANCSVCHDSAPVLAAANAMPVTPAGCFSCHGSMESESWNFTNSSFHLAYDETTTCTTCHVAGGIAPATVTAFHNGIVTERGGIIWNGDDTSVTEGAKFDWQITGIVDNGTNLLISWAAKYNGVDVNPCNAAVGPGAPVFHAAAGGNLSMLRSYAQGDDFILGQDPNAPGQAIAVNVTTTNTTCTGNVATTTIPVNTGITAARGIVALQGKPRVVNINPTATAPMAVRAKTPTREWIVGTGAQPTASRREIVDTGECLKCHVGSLYQHGGNRVDNVDMCVLCHNSASNEQSVRVGMGVEASEAYDGLVGQTFEMKTMLHAIHSAGIPGSSPIVIYRNRGIYAWASDESLLRNWPGNGSQIVFGSNNVTQNHTFHIPTYPRAINDCAACHGAKDFDLVPDQSKAVATTLDAGIAPWQNQLDDVLQGAGAAACTSCHSGSAAKGHAYQNGWNPAVFPNGRQTILDEAK